MKLEYVGLFFAVFYTKSCHGFNLLLESFITGLCLFLMHLFSLPNILNSPELLNNPQFDSVFHISSNLEVMSVEANNYVFK